MRGCLGLLLCLLALPALASVPPPYVIDDPHDVGRVTIYTEYLADTDDALTLNDIRSGSYDTLFIPARRGSQRLGFHNHPFWLRLGIRNSTGTELQRILELSPGLGASVTFFEPDANGYRERHSGTDLAIPWADLRSREQLFLINLPANETRVYYVRIVPSLSFGFSLNLHDLPGHFHTGLPGATPLTVQCGDSKTTLRLAVNNGKLSADINGTQATLTVLAEQDSALLYEMDGVRRRMAFARDGHNLFLDTANGNLHLVDVTQAPPATADGEGDGQLRAPMDGAVVDVLVSEGAAVKKGQTLIIMEAMKIEHQLKANRDGVVKTLSTSAKQQLKKRQLLLVIE